MSAPIQKRCLALDFDGVIHRYSKGWHTRDIYDPPMPGAYRALTELIERYHLIILTARPAPEVLKWCKEQFPLMRFELVPDDVVYWTQDNVVGVTNKKIPATAYVDDRGVRFTNWIDILNYFV